jgi:hypothetical protein
MTSVCFRTRRRSITTQNRITRAINASFGEG